MFSKADREILEFRDDVGKTRYADPLRVKRLLVYHLKTDPNALLRDAKSENQEQAFQAREKLLEGVRQAFELPSFDPTSGEGATEAVLSAALSSLYDFLSKKKVSTAGSRISSRPTELCQKVLYPTKSVWDYGRTEVGSNAGESQGG